jgi:predicted dehydrogenase
LGSEEMNKPAQTRPCRIAFVGAGYMASEHLKAFRDLPNIDLSGIYGRTRTKAAALAAEHGVGTVCDSVAELFEKTAADLVVVSVRELAVREVVEDCFRFPWACLIEKPVGYNLREAEHLAALAADQGRRAFVALNRRHYSSTQTVLNDLAANPQPRLIHVQDQEDLIAARASGQPELVVQNWMYANSIHMIDYFTMLGRGEVTEVQPLTRWNPDSPDFVIAKIQFDSGDIGLYQAIWNGPGPWAVSVTTQSKRWEMRPVEHAAFQPNGLRKLEPVPSHEWDQKFKPGLRRQAELAVAAACGKVVAGLPTLADALRSMRLAKAIYQLP